MSEHSSDRGSASNERRRGDIVVLAPEHSASLPWCLVEVLEEVILGMSKSLIGSSDTLLLCGTTFCSPMASKVLRVLPVQMTGKLPQFPTLETLPISL